MNVCNRFDLDLNFFVILPDLICLPNEIVAGQILVLA